MIDGGCLQLGSSHVWKSEAELNPRHLLPKWNWQLSCCLPVLLSISGIFCRKQLWWLIGTALTTQQGSFRDLEPLGTMLQDLIFSSSAAHSFVRWWVTAFTSHQCYSLIPVCCVCRTICLSLTQLLSSLTSETEGYVQRESKILSRKTFFMAGSFIWKKMFWFQRDKPWSWAQKKRVKIFVLKRMIRIPDHPTQLAWKTEKCTEKFLT